MQKKKKSVYTTCYAKKYVTICINDNDIDSTLPIPHHEGDITYKVLSQMSYISNSSQTFIHWLLIILSSCSQPEILWEP